MRPESAIVADVFSGSHRQWAQPQHIASIESLARMVHPRIPPSASHAHGEAFRQEPASGRGVRREGSADPQLGALSRRAASQPDLAPSRGCLPKPTLRPAGLVSGRSPLPAHHRLPRHTRRRPSLYRRHAWISRPGSSPSGSVNSQGPADCSRAARRMRPLPTAAMWLCYAASSRALSWSGFAWHRCKTSRTARTTASGRS